MIFSCERALLNSAINTAGRAVSPKSSIPALEGILLDPVYTGKAWVGMLKLLEQGYFDGQDNILFVHTGGAPGLYTKHHRIEFEKELMDGVTILE